MTNPNKVKMGKNSRAKGKAFELRVRHDLEKLGWIVCKWDNNVSEAFQIDIGEYDRKLIIAKHKFNFFTKAMTAGNGFPDFVCFKKNVMNDGWRVELVESKITGKLDREEKEKIRWLKDRLQIRVILAFKGPERGKILYVEQ